MPAAPSAMNLHLRYRLWIAEMNFDIVVIRIFDEYLTELRQKRKDPEVKSKIDYFEHQFKKLRTEIDDLRHEMHIGKMKLGAIIRDGKTFDYNTYKKENHIPLKKKHAGYKVFFKKINSEFCDQRGK
jgi:hypothetical protein